MVVEYRVVTVRNISRTVIDASGRHTVITCHIFNYSRKKNVFLASTYINVHKTSKVGKGSNYRAHTHRNTQRAAKPMNHRV